MTFTTAQIEGITKARLIRNLACEANEQFADAAAYVAWVCQMAGIKELPESAADSYAVQHAAKSVNWLEAELATAAEDANPPDVP